ncbi:MAG: hypothetical protein EP335_17820 [Alphaproteobacteria bacterium]|nr:MAG: hypothetical protein EP335_17820 [Alphaproteobacteria bacterium]
MRQLLVMLAVLVVSLPVAAADLSSDDIIFFREKSYERMIRRSSRETFEQIAYQLAKETIEPDMLVVRFADRARVEQPVARQYLATLIAFIRAREARGLRAPSPGCRDFEESAVGQGLATLGRLDTPGRLVVDIAGKVGQPACLLPMVAKMPGHARIVPALYEDSPQAPYLLAAITDGEISRMDSFLFIRHQARGFDLADMLAAIDYALAQLDDTETDWRIRNTLFAARLKYLLDAGLWQQAVAAFEALPKDEEQKFWALLNPESGADRHWRGKMQRSFYADMLLRLVAAHVLTDEAETAADLLDLYRADEAPDENDRDEQGRARLAAFLSEVLEPTLQGDEIYDRFLGIDSTAQAGPAKAAVYKSEGDWLGIVSRSGDTVRSLAARYLTGADYPGMARHVGTQVRQRPARDIEDIWATVPHDVAAPLRAGGDDYRQHMAALDFAPPMPATGAMVRIHGGPRPIPYRELEKPVGLQDGHPFGSEDYPADLLPSDVPVQGGTVRAEKTGDEWVIIVASHTLDPTAEVSHGGYWVLRTKDGGTAWRDALYMGLQEYFPYRVLSSSNMPLVTADGLDVEVERAALDRTSISFPPVALRRDPPRRGIYLHFTWADLERDSDADGLTDIYEHRIGLDLNNPDSDGDAIPDGADSLPLTPFRYVDHANRDLAVALLEPLWGADRAALIVSVSNAPDGTERGLDDLAAAAGKSGAAYAGNEVMVLRGDPELFEGLRLPGRVLVYDDNAIRALDSSYGLFYPPGLGSIFRRHDGSRLHVIWSAGWQGGTYELVRTETGYDVNMLSRWVS